MPTQRVKVAALCKSAQGELQSLRGAEREGEKKQKRGVPFLFLLHNNYLATRVEVDYSKERMKRNRLKSKH